jgi:copper homeostasis protein
MMEEEILIEICVDSVASAVAAERGGARRLELCSDLLEGGITPSAGMIELVRAKVSMAVQVMIRPRGGDFCYDADEFEIMQCDIETAKKLGADGVVFGILDAEGYVDVQRSRRLVELARPLDVTFHRAFDMSADLFRSLEAVYAAGANRILTSGGRPTALQGLRTISELVKAAKGRISIMPGSGIKPDNARRIVEESGVREIHAGLGSFVPSPMRFRNPRIAMGGAPEREYQRAVVLEESVRRLWDAVAIKDGGN